MDILFIKVFYYVSFAGYLLAFILTLKPSWIHIFKKVFTVSLVLNGAVFVLFWYRSGHFPFSEGFAESYVAMGFVLAMMSLLLSDSTSSPLLLGRYESTGIILLYAFSLGESLDPSSYLYWYNYPSVFCFFFFRIVSIAVMLFGAAFFAVGLNPPRSVESGVGVDMKGGRNYLLLGALLFLVSEICGAWWSAKASGDFWQFSPPFFTSAATFLLFMIPFHWPPVWSRKRRVKTFISACIPVLILVVVMIRNH